MLSVIKTIGILTLNPKTMATNNHTSPTSPHTTTPHNATPHNATRIKELAQQYPGRWGFFRYLTGLGFNIYNTYKNHFTPDIYEKLFAYLLKKDGFSAEHNIPKPMYWNNECIDATYDIPFLINGNVVMSIYALDRIDNPQRDKLQNIMKLTHMPYGMICNFDQNVLYTEKYIRDDKTGIIDKV